MALEHPEAAGKVFNVSDGEFHTLNIISTICQALGRKPPRLSLPVGPTLGLVGLVERIMGTTASFKGNSVSSPL